MRTTPQSPRSRFPKGQPRQSGNHAPNQHPPPRTAPPHRRTGESRYPEGRQAGRPTQTPIASPTPRRRGGSRTARPAAAGPSPHHQQPSPTPTPTIVVPALPHERHSCEGRNPEGRGAGRLRPPSRPPLPVAGPLPDSVRPEPVEACPEGTRRGPHHQHPPPPPTPPSSYWRKPVSRGARRGAPPSPIASPTPRRRGGSRTARPAAAGPSLHRHQQPSTTPTPHRRSRTPPRASFSRSDGNPTP